MILRAGRTTRSAGFTTIELLFVIAVFAVLAALSAPAIISSLRSSRVDSAAELILDANRQARALAMQAEVSAMVTGVAVNRSNYYGVVVVDDGSPATKPYVAVTYGASASAANILQVDTNDDGAADAPFYQEEFNRNVGVYSGVDHDNSVRINGAIGWLFQYNSGSLSLDGSQTLKPVFIGMDTSAGSRFDGSQLRISDITQTTGALSVRSVDQQQQIALTIYPTGLTSKEEL